jgi:tetratricopeptide (TPR) repeat protein
VADRIEALEALVGETSTASEGAVTKVRKVSRNSIAPQSNLAARCALARPRLMNPKTGLTACLIVKNEESVLDQCLSPLAGVVDDIAIGDTGSSDGTVEIASRYTTNIQHVAFSGSFSLARNAVLNQAETEWVLFLDADEMFTSAQAELLPNAVEEAPPDVLGLRVLRYDFFSTGGWLSSRRLRLFRNRPDVRYEGRINEGVGKSILRCGGHVADVPLILNHFGHCRPLADRQAKSTRYLELLREELLDNPTDGLRVAYRALHLRNLGRISRAVEESLRAVSLSPESATVHVFRGQVLRTAGDFRGARAAYREAIELNRPGESFWSDGGLQNLIGVTDLMVADIKAAARSFMRATELDPFLPHILVNTALLAEDAADFAEAARLYRQVADANPGFLLVSDSPARLGYDPILPSCYETVPHFAGLRRHLAFCEWEGRQR